jgi:hypothetical protein
MFQRPETAGMFQNVAGRANIMTTTDYNGTIGNGFSNYLFEGRKTETADCPGNNRPLGLADQPLLYALEKRPLGGEGDFISPSGFQGEG